MTKKSLMFYMINFVEEESQSNSELRKSVIVNIAENNKVFHV